MMEGSSGLAAPAGGGGAEPALPDGVFRPESAEEDRLRRAQWEAQGRGRSARERAVDEACLRLCLSLARPAAASAAAGAGPDARALHFAQRLLPPNRLDHVLEERAAQRCCGWFGCAKTVQVLVRTPRGRRSVGTAGAGEGKGGDGDGDGEDEGEMTVQRDRRKEKMRFVDQEKGWDETTEFSLSFCSRTCQQTYVRFREELQLGSVYSRDWDEYMAFAERQRREAAAPRAGNLIAAGPVEEKSEAEELLELLDIVDAAAEANQAEAARQAETAPQAQAPPKTQPQPQPQTQPARAQGRNEATPVTSGARTAAENKRVRFSEEATKTSAASQASRTAKAFPGRSEGPVKFQVVERTPRGPLPAPMMAPTTYARVSWPPAPGARAAAAASAPNAVPPPPQTTTTPVVEQEDEDSEETGDDNDDEDGDDDGGEDEDKNGEVGGAQESESDEMEEVRDEDLFGREMLSRIVKRAPDGSDTGGAGEGGADTQDADILRQIFGSGFRFVEEGDADTDEAVGDAGAQTATNETTPTPSNIPKRARQRNRRRNQPSSEAATATAGQSTEPSPAADVSVVPAYERPNPYPTAATAAVGAPAATTVMPTGQTPTAFQTVCDMLLETFNKKAARSMLKALGGRAKPKGYFDNPRARASAVLGTQQRGEHQEGQNQATREGDEDNAVVATPAAFAPADAQRRQNMLQLTQRQLQTIKRRLARTEPPNEAMWRVVSMAVQAAVDGGDYTDRGTVLSETELTAYLCVLAQAAARRLVETDQPTNAQARQLSARIEDYGTQLELWGEPNEFRVLVHEVTAQLDVVALDAREAAAALCT